MRRQRGFSLLELGIASLLGALLLSIVIQFFLSTLQIGQRSVIRSRLSQTGTTALLFLIKDLQQANAGGLTFSPDEEKRMIHCLIHPVEDINGDGLPTYSSQILQHYFLQPEKSLLMRRSFDGRMRCPILLHSGEPMRFQPDDIARIQAARAREKRFPGVSSLSISTYGVDPQFVGNPLRIEVILKEQREEIHCIRSVSLRNSL